MSETNPIASSSNQEPKPINIKIISTSLPIKEADSYTIFFSYTYESPHHPFICERVLKRETLIEHIETARSVKANSPIIQLLGPNSLLIADITFNGIPVSKPLILDATTVFGLSVEDKNKSNISEALQLLSLIINEFNGTLVYRGESRLFGVGEQVKQPVPKIFRRDQDLNFLYAFREAYMFNEYQHRFHEASFSNNFQWLADMQHFGMPTRLLDVTSNVLTALYFACQEDGYDGVLFSYSVDTPYVKTLEDFIKDFWCDITLIADLAQLKPFLERKLAEHQRIKVEFPNRIKLKRPMLESPALKINWIKKRILTEQMPEPYQKDFENFICDNLEAFFEMVVDVYIYCPLHITPHAYLNQRIVNQAGDFLLFPGKICWDDNDQQLNPLCLKNVGIVGVPTFNSVFIPAEWKPRLRRLLYDKFNVNEGTIYPDKEHIVNSIVKRWL